MNKAIKDSAEKQPQSVSDAAKNETRQLEEQMARLNPLIHLTDNMVKLGSLYKGPQEAPLSHRIRKLPSKGEVACANVKSMPPVTLAQDVEQQMQQMKADIQVRKIIAADYMTQL